LARRALVSRSRRISSTKKPRGFICTIKPQPCEWVVVVQAEAASRAGRGHEQPFGLVVPHGTQRDLGGGGDIPDAPKSACGGKGVALRSGWWLWRTCHGASFQPATTRGRLPGGR
jgi:hypothetical protein